MFKRILVLVVFLSLVFWWLSNRNDDKIVTETPEKEVQIELETESESEDEDETAVEGEEEAEVNEVETVTITETEVTPEPVVAETKAVETATKTETPVKPVVVAPVTPVNTYRPPAEPIVSIPDVQTNVKVYMYEWNVDLSMKTIPSGTVNFQVQNDGRFTHDFSISGYGNLGKVGPGQSQTFTIKLKPGTYEAFSDRRQDYERGVKENFIIN